MQNLSDEDIDKLFKRAAEQQQAQFDPADWDNMANRLDANKRPWLNYYIWTGSIVLLGVVIWLGWLINKPTTMPATENVSTSLQKEATSTSNKSKPVDDLTASSSVANTLSTSIVKEEDVIENQSASDENNSANQSAKKVIDKVLRSAEGNSNSQSKSPTEKLSSITDAGTSNSSKTLTSSISSSQYNQNELANQFSVRRKNDLAKDQNNKSNADLNSNLNLNESQSNATSMVIAESTSVISNEESVLVKSQTNLETNVISTHAVKEQQSLHNVQTTPVDVVDSVEKVMEEEEKMDKKNVALDSYDSVSKKSTFSRFAVKATVAPDFSSDQFKSMEKMGFNYGLVVEYFLNKNFSVATGAIWSRKYYSAIDVDYNGYHADRAYGDCRMWDIPLNVNYYFTPSKRFSFFASAGLSSYLMNEENYDYEVDTAYGTNTYTSQVIKENKEWFKTVNVSVGLQKQISSRLAIQVEPFVKVPLAGVGEGNISLASFGGFFSVRYNFLTLQK